MNDSVPATGRLAGIDYGTRRMGIALSDARQILASPHGMHPRGDQAADARFFRQLARDESLVGFVVGLPVHASGQESRKSEEARQFGRWLAEITGLPVVFYDERYTTRLAEQSLLGADLPRKKRKQRRDMVAAQLILAGFLESHRSAESYPLEDDA
jgi:putative Holliday junction resolvase